VLDYLVVSLGAIVGANARWIISRYAATVLGPVFPLWHTDHQRSWQPDGRLFCDLDH
jgi:hypothetical protein